MNNVVRVVGERTEKWSNFWGCHIFIQSIVLYKGIVRVILSDPSCKDDNARFTTVPFKALSDQELIVQQCL